MYLEKIHVDCGIYVVVLKACSSIYALNEGQKIHTEILLKRYEKYLFVQHSLVDLQAKCCAVHEACIIVKDLFVWGDVLWNVLLFGYSNNGFSQEVLMQLENQAPSTTTLVSIFKACGNSGAVDRLHQTHMEIFEKGELGERSYLATRLQIHMANVVASKMYKIFGEIFLVIIQMYHVLYVAQLARLLDKDDHMKLF